MSASEVLVEAQGVWRQYRLANAAHRTTLRGSLAGGVAGVRRQRFWALKDVDLTLRRGQAIAVIGSNGAGKTTLLRLVGGIGRPDRGRLAVQGRVGALLDLGREFHPDLTGYQNAELAAVVAGLTRAEFRSRIADMVEFSGLRDFVDQPLHTYSDGMRARLAFSVAVHVDPDALLVDEVLAVGDAAFQRRSIERIEVMLSRGVGVLFVSHDPTLVRRVCDQAVWLAEGTVRAIGPSDEVVSDYLSATVEPRGPSAVEDATRSPPILEATIQDVWGVPTTGIGVGDGLVVGCRVRVPESWGPQHLSVKIYGKASLPAVDTSTVVGADDEQLHLRFSRLDLAPGDHEVSVSVQSLEWTQVHSRTSIPLTLRGEGPDRASLAPPHEWTRRRNR